MPSPVATSGLAVSYTHLKDGEPSVWCQQNDRETLKPAPARAYELPSYCPQLLYIISISLLAELSETGQVLPDLGGGQPHGAPQGIGGNSDGTGLKEIVQVAVIPRQPPDYGAGYLLLSHRFITLTLFWLAVFPSGRVLRLFQ